MNPLLIRDFPRLQAEVHLQVCGGLELRLLFGARPALARDRGRFSCRAYGVGSELRTHERKWKRASRNEEARKETFTADPSRPEESAGGASLPPAAPPERPAAAQVFLPGIKPVHHVAEPLQVSKDLWADGTALRWTCRPSVGGAGRRGAPETAAGSPCLQTGTPRTRPGWRWAGPRGRSARSPAHTQSGSGTRSLTCAPEPAASTHTLHQVQSLFWEEVLLSVHGEARRLPELSLQRRDRSGWQSAGGRPHKGFGARALTAGDCSSTSRRHGNHTPFTRFPLQTDKRRDAEPKPAPQFLMLKLSRFQG